MKILIVEDDFESRSLLAEILAAEGYDARAADSAELALASVAVIRPALILLDIRMPGMDGFELCRRLKKNVATRDIPVIFLTAAGELQDRVGGFRLGAVDFITKPFHREELLARIRTHLELAELRAHLAEQVERRSAELRESEQRFRRMADAAPVLIWTSGANKVCTFFNRVWLEFTGRNLEQEFGDGWTVGIHPDDRARWNETYSSSFEARRSFQMEYRLRRADGEYRWLLGSGVPRFNSRGAFSGYIGSCIDITDLKLNHEQMLAAQKLESLGLMAAGIAHDFGNLLGNILAQTDLAISEMPAGLSCRENLDRIASVAEYAIEIVRMLMVSAGAGIYANKMEAVDLASLATDTLHLLDMSIPKQVVVRMNFEPELPPLRGNVAQLRQLVMNLVTNAAEAIGDRKGSITISLQRVRGGSRMVAGSSAQFMEPDYIRLKVSDTGCGMTAETRSRIFDQFFTTKAVGRGLGLAAVHGIVRAHQGVIQVESEPGLGSTFELLFPSASQGQEGGPAHTAACCSFG